MDDPNYYRTVKDKTTGQDVVLSDKDLDTIQRIQQGMFPTADYDPYEVCFSQGPVASASRQPIRPACFLNRLCGLLV